MAFQLDKKKKCFKRKGKEMCKETDLTSWSEWKWIKIYHFKKYILWHFPAGFHFVLSQTKFSYHFIMFLYVPFLCLLFKVDNNRCFQHILLLNSNVFASKTIFDECKKCVNLISYVVFLFILLCSNGCALTVTLELEVSGIFFKN